MKRKPPAEPHPSGNPGSPCAAPAQPDRTAPQRCGAALFFSAGTGRAANKKSPGGLAGPSGARQRRAGPLPQGIAIGRRFWGSNFLGGITKECDAWPKGSAGRLPGAFGGWGSVLGLVEHGLALALHPIARCRQHHACAQHQVCQPAAGAGLDQLGILHRREHRGLRSGSPHLLVQLLQRLQIPAGEGTVDPEHLPVAQAGGCRRLPAGRRADPPAGAPGTAMPAAPRCPPHSLFEPVPAVSAPSCQPPSFVPFPGVFSPLYHIRAVIYQRAEGNVPLCRLRLL